MNGHPGGAPSIGIECKDILNILRMDRFKNSLFIFKIRYS